jgi:FAD synthase
MMEVAFVEKLRDQRTFATDGALSEQIAADVETAARSLDEAPPPDEELLA